MFSNKASNKRMRSPTPAASRRPRRAFLLLIENEPFVFLLAPPDYRHHRPVDDNLIAM